MLGSFFDTDVLMYVASGNPAKADRVEKLIGDGGTISVQVLNEMTNVAHLKMGMSWTETRAFVSIIRRLLAVQPIGVEVHETAIMLADHYRLSIRDAMIAASALHADCNTLWSEDMRDGMAIGSYLRVANPFRAAS